MEQQRHTNTATAAGQRRQRGSIVVYLALALVVFGLLAMAGLTRFGSTLTSVLSPNCATAARHMAESGLRYAVARLRACTTVAQLDTTVSALNSGNYTMDSVRGRGFTLSVSYDANYRASVTSTGRGCSIIAPATATAATPSGGVNLPVVAASDSGTIDFSNLADDFMRTSALSSTNPITVDSATKTISFGTVTGTHNAAAIWYAGNSTLGCVDGNCTMDNGLRAYFDVQWDSASRADGLVFGIMSAVTNTIKSVGGDPYMGELMGWAGPGTTTGTGKGIQPPKIGMELDTWYNACGSSQFLAASRCDPSSASNPDENNSPDHMAFVFWGSNTDTGSETVNLGGGTWVTRRGATYDDNRHGAGTGSSTEPVSSNDPDDSGNGLYGIYYPSTPLNWLRNGTKYYVRFELTRLTTLSSGSTYCYQLKTWIISTTPDATYKNITVDYDANTYVPTIQQVIFLNSTYHTQLNKVFFGWTEATGDYAQYIKVGNFALTFKKAQPTYGTAPTGYTAYWPMYNNISTSVTEVANARTGTIRGTARWVPGIANNNGAALYFNGNTYMYATDNTNLDPMAEGGISLWFKMTAANTGKWILHKGTTTTGNEAYGLQVNSSGKLRFVLRSGTSAYTEVISGTTLEQDKWYHVAATWKNGSTPLTLYLNGASNVATANTTNSARNSGGYLYLGAGDSTTSHGTLSTGFTGVIDEVYIYKTVLTQAGITALATGTP